MSYPKGPGSVSWEKPLRSPDRLLSKHLATRQPRLGQGAVLGQLPLRARYTWPSDTSPAFPLRFLLPPPQPWGGPEKEVKGA